ncbi:MAG: outer membrane beta-barrel protein [Proteobacteria bacterium]|nr:outer membrane beta-barrel protein [Pseudomonadota bacterium]
MPRRMAPSAYKPAVCERAGSDRAAYAVTVQPRRARMMVRPAVLLSGLIASLASPHPATAQNIPVYFPSGSYGYDRQLGVTVLSRARPLYQQQGIHAGGFTVLPTFDEALFYNSDVTGAAGSGSWGVRTSGNVSAESNWERNSAAASVGFGNNVFFALPNDSYTDWNAAVGGTYQIGRDLLEGAFSHVTYHQFGTSLAALQSSTPVSNQTDTAHAAYSIDLNRISITPDFSFSAYRYGIATVQGQQISQTSLNRNVFAASLISRYSMSEEGGLLLVLRGIASDFPSPAPSQPSNNSTSYEVLTGLDYQANSVWRYRALVGIEVRDFQAAQYKTHTAPVLEASVIWTPTGLTTVTGTLSREIEDPTTAGNNGYVLTAARGVVDHELLRNVLLQGRVAVASATYLQTVNGTQTSYTLGGGVTWLINRTVRLSLDYDFTQQLGQVGGTNAANPGTIASAPFTQSIAMLTLHIAL